MCEMETGLLQGFCEVVSVKCWRVVSPGYAVTLVLDRSVKMHTAE